jgi:hypothetical protein
MATYSLPAVRMERSMKQLLFGLLFAAVAMAAPVEVDVTLTNGRKVTGNLVSENDREIVLVVTASNGLFHQTINKADIAGVQEHVTVKPPGLRDVTQMQKNLKVAEDDVHRRDAVIAAAQKALDDFYGSHPLPNAASADKERKLRAKLATARMQAETAHAKLNTLTTELETMSRHMAEPAPQAK